MLRERKANPPRLTYRRLRNLIAGLIEEGKGITGPRNRSKRRTVEEWLSRALRALTLLEVEMPSVLVRFKKLKFRQLVPEDQFDETSHSAYRDEADRLIDFDFSALKQAVRALELARQAVELRLSSGRKQTRNQTRKKTSPPPATDKVIETSHHDKTTPNKGDKGRSFNARRLRAARDAHHLNVERTAAWFGVSKRHYVRWEQGHTVKMHQDNHGCYERFIKCAENGIPLPDRCDTKMSPSLVTNKTP
ncbi:MAG: hypothetical protein JWO19_1935 [Bryobacterales bacterium]|nr:hypothetical protein [Bryobacterales bacterium]